jgi:hypothetical protein
MQSLGLKGNVSFRVSWNKKWLNNHPLWPHCLILGSLGRKGLDAVQLGNRAEYIIGKVNYDISIVKH